MQAEVEFHRRGRESAEMAKLEMIGTEKPTLQEPAKDPERLEWHEACLPKPLPALQATQQVGRRKPSAGAG